MRSRILAVMSIAAVTLALLAAAASAQESKGGSYTKIPTVKGIDTLKAGARAPDFAVRDLGGKEFRLKDCAGKNPAMLFFWSFFCGPCREEMPMINEMTRQYSDRGLQVIGVNLDGVEMKKAIDKFAAAERIGFRIVFDELEGDTFRVADPYGVAGTPALFIIDRTGTINFAAVGAVTPQALRAEIEKVLK